jgi:hypothetical protein
MGRIAVIVLALTGCASEPPPHYPTTPSRVAPEFSYATMEQPPPPPACRCLDDVECIPRGCNTK